MDGNAQEERHVWQRSSTELFGLAAPRLHFGETEIGDVGLEERILAQMGEIQSDTQ